MELDLTDVIALQAELSGKFQSTAQSTAVKTPEQETKTKLQETVTTINSLTPNA